MFGSNRGLGSMGCTCMSAYCFHAFNVGMLGKGPRRLRETKDVFISRAFIHSIFNKRSPIKRGLSLSGRRRLAIHNICRSAPRGATCRFSFMTPVCTKNNCVKNKA